MAFHRNVLASISGWCSGLAGTRQCMWQVDAIPYVPTCLGRLCWTPITNLRIAGTQWRLWLMSGTRRLTGVCQSLSKTYQACHLSVVPGLNNCSDMALKDSSLSIFSSDMLLHHVGMRYCSGDGHTVCSLLGRPRRRLRSDGACGWPRRLIRLSIRRAAAPRNGCGSSSASCGRLTAMHLTQSGRGALQVEQAAHTRSNHTPVLA